jgi:hypothetical protein
MGIPTFFILVLFLKFFQFFFVFTSFFYFPTKKTSVALAGYGFARLDFVRPRSITSGLLGHGVPKSIKNYSQFSFFGGGHD